MEAAIFKSLGVLPGVPDLLIFERGGLAVEFKATKGRCTKAQEVVQRQLVDRGWRVEVVRDLETFVSVVSRHLLP